MHTSPHLLALAPMERPALERLLDRAWSLLHDLPDPLSRALSGRTVGLLFFEPSTRTRVSFELAAKRLGASTILLDEGGSSLTKGESVLDTCQNLAAMGVDVFVIRHRSRGVLTQLARALDSPILNAGDGDGEHPSQGLLDVLTLCERWSDGPEDPSRYDLRGRRVALVGDIAHSRVARSDVHALLKLGAQVVLAGPEGLVPQAHAPGWEGAQRATSLDEAIEGADALITLRVQRERLGQLQVDHEDYVAHWRVEARHMARLKPEGVVLHPGPVIRGEELEAEVADGPRSLILRQVRCGVAVRQALLLEALGA